MTNKNNFNLLKDINEQADEHQAEQQVQLDEAGDMSPSNSDIQQKFGSIRELQKIANYWKQHGQQMDENELRERVAYDLEQLEYTPEQIDEYVPRILKMIHGEGEGEENEEYAEEPDDDIDHA